MSYNKEENKAREKYILEELLKNNKKYQIVSLPDDEDDSIYAIDAIIKDLEEDSLINVQIKAANRKRMGFSDVGQRITSNGNFEYSRTKSNIILKIFIDTSNISEWQNSKVVGAYIFNLDKIKDKNAIVLTSENINNPIYKVTDKLNLLTIPVKVYPNGGKEALFQESLNNYFPYVFKKITRDQILSGDFSF